MKKLLLVLLALPTIASAQVFMAKPDVLQLKKYRALSGKLELRYIRENPRQVIRIGAGNKATDDFFEKLMKSDISKLNCDGDFFPMMNSAGLYIHVNSLKSCIDEDGDVIAHSIGITALSDADVAKSKKFIEDSLKVVGPTPANVNDSNKPKEVVDPTAGVFSPKLIKSTGTPK